MFLKRVSFTFRVSFKTFLVFVLFISVICSSGFAVLPRAGGPYFGYINHLILFSGLNSIAPEGSIYIWDFGDGTNGTGKEVQHTYENEGIYEVTLTIKTETENGSDTTTATIERVAPVVDIIAPLVVQRGHEADFYVDVAGFRENEQLTVHWDFGDNTIGYGESQSHTYSEAGDYNIVVSVTDGYDTVVENLSLDVYEQGDFTESVVEISQQIQLYQDKDNNKLFSPGDVAKYVITISNTDDERTVEKVKIQDTLPKGTLYLYEGQIVDNTVLNFEIEKLKPNSSEKIEIPVMITNEARHTKTVNFIEGEYFDSFVWFSIQPVWLWKYIHDSELVHGPYSHGKDFHPPWEFTNGEGYFYVDEFGDLEPMEWDSDHERYYDPRPGGGYISKGKFVPGCNGKHVAKGIHPNVQEDLNRFAAEGWMAHLHGTALGPGASVTIYIVNSTLCTMPNRYDARVLYRNPKVEGGDRVDVVKKLTMGKDITFCQWLMFEIDCPDEAGTGDDFWDGQNHDPGWQGNDGGWPPVNGGNGETDTPQYDYPGFDSETDIEFYYLADFGDAQDPSYPSYLRNNGARHFITDFEWLGKNVTVENDAKVMDLDEYDDGVVFNIIPNSTSSAEITLTVWNRNAFSWEGSQRYDPNKLLYVNGWIDFNNDSAWSENEHVFSIAEDVTTWDSNSKTVRVEFNTPEFNNTQVWARIRLDYNENITTPTGSAVFGEVEDHLVEVSIYQPPQQVILYLGIAGAGVLILFFIFFLKPF